MAMALQPTTGPKISPEQANNNRLGRDAARIDIREFDRLLTKFDANPDVKTLELIGVCLGTITTKYGSYQPAIIKADDLLRKTLVEGKAAGFEPELEAVLTAATSIRKTKLTDGIIPATAAEKVLLQTDFSHVTDENFHAHVAKLSKEFDAATGEARMLKGVEASALYYAVGKKFCEDNAYQNLVEKVTLDGLEKGQAHGFYGLGHLERTIDTDRLASILGNKKTPTFIAVELLHWASIEQFIDLKDRNLKFGTPNIETAFNSLYNKKTAPLAPGLENVPGRVYKGKAIVGIRKRELKKYGITITEHKFGADEIQERGEALQLTQDKIDVQKKLGLTTHTVKSEMTGKAIPDHIIKALHSRYSGMNRYGGEEETGHIEETAGTERDLATRMGGTVVYTQVGGKDASYSSMYPVSADYEMAKAGTAGSLYPEGLISPDNAEYFRDAANRVKWGAVGELLASKIQVPGIEIPISALQHLTDTAIGPNHVELEKHGLNKFTLSQLMTKVEPEKVLVGFIDYGVGGMDHRASVVSSLQIGRIIFGATSRGSHDGSHCGFYTASSPSLEPNFSESDTVLGRLKGEGAVTLDSLVKKLTKAIVTDRVENADKIIAFDPKRQAFVLTTLKLKGGLDKNPFKAAE